MFCDEYIDIMKRRTKAGRRQPKKAFLSSIVPDDQFFEHAGGAIVQAWLSYTNKKRKKIEELFGRAEIPLILLS